jgi:hypothetical protein
MEIKKEIYTAHKGLSTCSSIFLEFAKKNPDALKRSNFNSILLEEQFKEKPIQPWPAFVNKKTKEEMEKAAVKVYNLIKRIPERIFAYDFFKISDYYEIPIERVELLFYGTKDEDIEHLLARGDFVFSSNGLKCVEYNVDSNLGGWELDLLESLYINNPIIETFIKENDVQIRKNNFFPLFLGFLVDRALDKFSNRMERLNLALVLPKYREVHAQSHLTGLYRNLLQQKRDGLMGNIIICLFDELTVVDDSVFYRDEKIHIAVEMTNGLVPFMILHAAKSGNIFLYNGPISRIMSNKLNLALLSEHENSYIFSLEEREVIKKYIPWTRKITPTNTTYRNQEIPLIKFIRSNKDEFLIKPASGYSGEEVHPGANVSEMEWDILIKRAVEEKIWVVQEYIDSLSYLHQSGEYGCVEHQAVWGFFVFGSQYAGGTVRILPGKGEKGVINVGQGAEKSIIIEVEE